MFKRRTSYGKTGFMLETETNQLQTHPRLGPNVREQWIRWRGDAGGLTDGEAQGFTISSLPFLCDNFRPIVDAYGEMGNWFPTMCCSVGLRGRRRRRRVGVVVYED
jgi:hypothetical protein